MSQTYSYCSFAREPFNLISAIFGVIRGNLLDLDICSVVTPTEKLYAFLSVTWGMVSDVDIESEKYRYLGETRFLIGTIAKIIGLRKYRGRIDHVWLRLKVMQHGWKPNQYFLFEVKLNASIVF